MLTFVQWEGAIAAIADPVARLVAGTAWDTGFDLGEVLGLRVNDVDIENKIIRSGGIEIPISTDLQSKLLDYRSVYRIEAGLRERFFTRIGAEKVSAEILKSARRFEISAVTDDN